MSDHADDRAWTITRLLYATQFPFLLICTAVFAGAVNLVFQASDDGGAPVRRQLGGVHAPYD